MNAPFSVSYLLPVGATRYACSSLPRHCTARTATLAQENLALRYTDTFFPFMIGASIYFAVILLQRCALLGNIICVYHFVRAPTPLVNRTQSITLCQVYFTSLCLVHFHEMSICLVFRGKAYGMLPPVVTGDRLRVHVHEEFSHMENALHGRLIDILLDEMFPCSRCLDSAAH